MRNRDTSQVTIEPPTHFGGPVGALVLTLFTPMISLYLWLCIHRRGGGLWLPRSLDDLREIPLPTWRAAGLFGAWLALQVGLHVLAPGRTENGMPLRDGERLPYRVNGWFAFLFSTVLLITLFATRLLDPWLIVNELGALLMIAILGSFVLGVWLYVHGIASNRNERRSGNAAYDFFMGTGLNPRLGWFDLKFFFESRIGMGTWGALVVTMLAAGYMRDGTVPLPLALVSGFQLVYIADFFWFESALLSTWDIMHENFGYMLSQAFLLWIPFNFSLQSQYLMTHTPQLSTVAIIGLCLLNFGGYYIFRATNLQKHRFRTDPTALIWGQPPSYIKTKRGTLLLTAGWWGVARHINYLGDLMMALAWCLACGFSHLAPYFYFIYFAPLLINRERRDHFACRAKYGEDWDAYCKRVPWRMLPWVY
jgi:delta14-sterol reductase